MRNFLGGCHLIALTSVIGIFDFYLRWEARQDIRPTALSSSQTQPDQSGARVETGSGAQGRSERQRHVRPEQGRNHHRPDEDCHTVVTQTNGRHNGLDNATVAR